MGYSVNTSLVVRMLPLGSLGVAEGNLGAARSAAKPNIVVWVRYLSLFSQVPNPTSHFGTTYLSDFHKYWDGLWVRASTTLTHFHPTLLDTTLQRLSPRPPSSPPPPHLPGVKMALQSKFWCFTLHLENLAEEDTPLGASADEHPWDDRVEYAIWQLEACPETGNLHMQGYVEFFGNQRLSAVRRYLPTAHWEKRRGSDVEAREYCRKQDHSYVDGPWEYGEFEPAQQGKRTDLDAAVEALKAGGIKRVAEACPTAYIKYSRGFAALRDALDDNTLPSDEGFVPRPWQKRVLQHLAQEPNDRRIYWVTDTRGNHGKSRLARNLIADHKAVALEGKIADMAYMYNKEPIVIFDITRAQAEHSAHLYSFAEKLKGGYIVSTKWETRQKCFKPPHVIFFANFSWDREKWSHDRVYEFDLNNPDLHRAEPAIVIE